MPHAVTLTLSGEQVAERIRSALPDAISAVEPDGIVLAPARAYDAMAFMRDDEQLDAKYLVQMCSVDAIDRIDVVYHLYSLSKGWLLRVKAAVGEAEEIDSVVPVWKTANWLERETYDMYGVRFANHPDLRRILLTDNFEGYPFRKDYPLAGY